MKYRFLILFISYACLVYLFYFYFDVTISFTHFLTFKAAATKAPSVGCPLKTPFVITVLLQTVPA